MVGESESDKETVPFQISVVTLDPVENFHHAKQMNVLFKPNGRNGTRILHAQKRKIIIMCSAFLDLVRRCIFLHLFFFLDINLHTKSCGTEERTERDKI